MIRNSSRQGRLFRTWAATTAVVVGFSLHTISTTSAAVPTTPHEADKATDVTDTLGINLHPSFAGTPYTNVPLMTQRLQELGVTHARTKVPTSPALAETIKSLNAKGIKFNFTIGKPDDGSAETTKRLNTLSTFNGATESVEGVNEWNIIRGQDIGVPSSRPNWAPEARAYQTQIYNFIKNNPDPEIRKIRVLSSSISGKEDYEEQGDYSAISDAASLHLYVNGNVPSTGIDEVLQKAQITNPGQPAVFSESGYHSAFNSTQGGKATPDDVSATYGPRLLMEHYTRGTERVYIYELFDQNPNPELDEREDNFGIVRNDGTPKPVFNSLSNMMATLKDTNTQFTPKPLSYSLNGSTSGVKQQLVQKSNGRYDLILWRDAKIWDSNAKTYVNVATQDVTINLANNAQVSTFVPAASRMAKNSYASTSSVNVSLGADLTIVEIDPSRQAVTTTTTQRPTTTTTARPTTTTTARPTTTTTARPTTTTTIVKPRPVIEKLYFNFGSADTTRPVDYVLDTGQPFSTSRGYGWETLGGRPQSLVGNGRLRNIEGDKRKDSFVHMQLPTNSSGVHVESRWQAVIPNGEYIVTASVGDPAYTDSHHVLRVEGRNLIDFRPTPAMTSQTKWARFTVTDGRLTVDALGGTNTKLNFLVITPAS